MHSIGRKIAYVTSFALLMAREETMKTNRALGAFVLSVFERFDGDAELVAPL